MRSLAQSSHRYTIFQMIYHKEPYDGYIFIHANIIRIRTQYSHLETVRRSQVHSLDSLHFSVSRITLWRPQLVTRTSLNCIFSAEHNRSITASSKGVGFIYTQNHARREVPAQVSTAHVYFLTKLPGEQSSQDAIPNNRENYTCSKKTYLNKKIPTSTGSFIFKGKVIEEI